MSKVKLNNRKTFLVVLIIVSVVVIIINNILFTNIVPFEKIAKSPIQNADLQKELISVLKDIANKYITWSTVILGFIILNCFLKSESHVLFSKRNSFLIPIIFVCLLSSLFYAVSMIGELAKFLDNAKIIQIPMESGKKTDLIRKWDFTSGWFAIGFVSFSIYIGSIILKSLGKEEVK